MKNFLIPIAALAALTTPLSCLVPAPAKVEPAHLRVSLRTADTRSTEDPLDTASYDLCIEAEDGKKQFDGLLSDCPAEIELQPGTYCVSVQNRSFTQPDFDCPQFGDARSVTLKEGETGEVRLTAGQQNAGLRLQVSERFVANYKESALFLRSAKGNLAWGWDETRTAYFFPGKVALSIDSGGSGTTIYTADIGRGEIMTLKIDISENLTRVDPMTGLGISITIDTLRTRTQREFAWDGSTQGSSGPSEAVPAGLVRVEDARKMAGSIGVWVCGYIVGGDLSSSSCSFAGPFSSRTNMVIADSPSCDERDLCMSVQLAAGDIRNALNLVDNPSNLGRRVYLKGDIVEAYYKLPGLQKLSEFRLP